MFTFSTDYTACITNKLNQPICLLWAESVFKVLIECIVQYCYGSLSASFCKADGGTRISGIQDLEDKDIILGGLLRVHKHDDNGKCGKVYVDKTMENLEAVLFAIDIVNSDPNCMETVQLWKKVNKREKIVIIDGELYYKPGREKLMKWQNIFVK